jgi:hypothetical protein
MKFAPICLFVYNRPWHTTQTLEHLIKNIGADKSELIVYSDGARDSSDSLAVEEVRKIIENIVGFRKVNLIKRAKNVGLAQNIIEGVTAVLEQYKKIIVLEDDLITSPYFLNYMNRGLDLYEPDPRVASIHGYCYPVKNNLPETFFIKGADCWGYATWQRAWEKFEPDGQKLVERIVKSGRKKEFDFNNSYGYFTMLQDQIKGKNNSWAVRWYASAFLADMYTLYPYPSLVQNIGLDNSGTHSGSFDKPGKAIEIKEILFGPIPVEENSIARKEFEKYFRSLRGLGSYIYRIIKLLKKILN